MIFCFKFDRTSTEADLDMRAWQWTWMVMGKILDSCLTGRPSKKVLSHTVFSAQTEESENITQMSMWRSRTSNSESCSKLRLSADWEVSRDDHQATTQAINHGSPGKTRTLLNTNLFYSGLVFFFGGGGGGSAYLVPKTLTYPKNKSIFVNTPAHAQTDYNASGDHWLRSGTFCRADRSSYDNSQLVIVCFSFLLFKNNQII